MRTSLGCKLDEVSRVVPARLSAAPRFARHNPHEATAALATIHESSVPKARVRLGGGFCSWR
jgi:hypothetical protein